MCDNRIYLKACEGEYVPMLFDMHFNDNHHFFVMVILRTWVGIIGYGERIQTQHALCNAETSIIY